MDAFNLNYSADDHRFTRMLSITMIWKELRRELWEKLKSNHAVHQKYCRGYSKHCRFELNSFNTELAALLAELDTKLIDKLTESMLRFQWSSGEREGPIIRLSLEHVPIWGEDDWQNELHSLSAEWNEGRNKWRIAAQRDWENSCWCTLEKVILLNTFW